MRDLYQFVQKVVEDRGWHSADPDHAKSTFQATGFFLSNKIKKFEKSIKILSKITGRIFFAPNSQAMRHTPVG